MNLEISAAYDPISLIYTVTVGKNSVEIPGHTLTQKHVEELAKMLEGINDDTLAKATLNVWAAAINKSISYRAIDTDGNLMFVDSDSVTYDDNAKTTAIDASKIAAGRVRDVLAAWKDTRTLLSPYDYGDEPKVYYQPRYLSKSSELIIDDVIKLLDDYKGLNVKKVYMFKKPSAKFGSEIDLGLISDIPQNHTGERLLQVYMDHRVFDRTYKMDTDKEAGLAAKLDTDTYIVLRIAFLIYKSLKVDQEEAAKINSDGFRVIGRYDRPKSL